MIINTGSRTDTVQYYSASRVGKAGSGSHLHKFSSYKCYIFKSSILRNSGARKNVLKTTQISTFTIKTS